MMWDEQTNEPVNDRMHDRSAGRADAAPRDSRMPDAPAAGGSDSDGIADFETALAELEQTVRRLESGEAGLAEAMALFQKGTALSAACDRYLTQAETVINQLVEQPDGSFETAAFVPETAPGSGGAHPGDGA